MRFSVVFLALFALAAAIPAVPKLNAANQEFLTKQQDVIYLLENIAGTLPNVHLHEIGMNYVFEPHLQNYENPSVVKYYLGLYHSGHVQPQHTPFSYSISELRKEVSLLTQILLGAKDYVTFINTAAWARVHVNEDQFVTAFSQAVLQSPYMQGVILPPPYEVYPHYFFDAKIIQKVQDYVNKYALDYQVHGEKYGVYNIYVNYTSYLPYGENQIAYFTEDIGLSAYYYYVQLASYMIPYGEYAQHYGHTEEGVQHHIGHGSYYYYIHQQLLARYNLERLGQGLGPIRELDYYYEHIETPFKPYLHHLNGIALPGRDEHTYITPRHHNYQLVKLVRLLEQRVLDAIHSGHVITPQGVFLSIYQPQGLNILGELIEGTGRSINPRYYGSFMYVARQLLGNAPAFNNIYEYIPSPLELGQTAVRDPIFYQLYNKIIELFHYYQEGLPAYQYNDIVVPGVNIEKVDVSQLVTYFSDYQVDLSNAVVQPVVGSGQEHQTYPHVVANLKRLDHKPYEYSLYVQSQKVMPGAVIRLYVGPKYNYDGQPIDINIHRHYFYELDQFVYDLVEGQNVIVRNSHQATGQSYDWPSVHQLMQQVQGAFSSQSPYYIHYPEQLYGFPARLSLPKGSQSGFPLQFFFIISSGVQQPVHYGPVTEEVWRTYQPHHYQVVGHEEYEQFVRNPIDKINGGYQNVEVIPDFDAHIITNGNFHYGYLYKNYPGSYYYPHWQQTYYNNYGGQVHHNVQQHVVPEGYKAPYIYQKVVEHPQGGVHQQTVFKQGMYEGQIPEGYYGSGHYPGNTGYYGSHVGNYQGYQGHDDYVHNYYKNQYIGDIIGGALSLDNKPLGYPLDRPMAPSALYASNIYIKDVIVYHIDEIIPEY